MSEKRIITQRGLYFDELEEGVIYRHQPGRTLSEADNILFTTLTMNTQALHLDAAFSESQPFGRRLVNSMLTLSTLVGLSVSQLTQGTIIGQLGLDKVVFPKPVFHGDTLYAESEVLSKRPSKSRPGQGIVVFGLIGRNQSGEVVAQAERTVLMKAQESTGQSAEDESWEGHS
ncbi:MaoC family dehydratase [Haematomicrobium sanguinis]|uniref:MaoC family dehydratase n=1 Tax=Haematomicrobium sanguinis TaxID=479106 RepID=UPI0005546137|nr:MaoC family dehydratase [Haematomicrobium sanguinis]